MRKTMIRNTVIMVLVTLILSLGLALYVRSTFANPVAGDVYASTQQGFGGEIPVEVVINNGKVVSVTADVSTETPELGGKAGPEVAAAIVAAGTTEGVDTVAGATVTSTAVLNAVNDCLAQAGAGASGDVYTSVKAGFHGDIEFTVTVADGKIVAMDADFSEETPGLGQDAGPKLIEAIVAAGSAEGVDGVSGSTMTSNAVIAAAKDALEQAGGAAEPTEPAAPVEGTAYTSVQEGFHGEIEFTVTVNEGKIVAIDADFSEETPGLGQDAGPKLVEAIVAAGSAEGVDAVSGSTLTSKAVLAAAVDALAQAGGAAAPAETAEPAAPAEGNVYTSVQKGFGGEIEFKVTVADGKITAIDADFSQETPGLGQDAGPKLVEAIVAAGSAEGVDAVSGSTLTSKAVLAAAADALAQAGL